jgi:hypothetical protein
MTHKAISPLRQRMIEDMSVRKFGEKTQADYLRHVENFAKFLGRSPDTATGRGLAQLREGGRQLQECLINRPS